MCGRFLILSDEENAEILEIMENIEKKYSGNKTVKLGEMFPGTDIPILTGSVRSEHQITGSPDTVVYRSGSNLSSRDTAALHPDPGLSNTDKIASYPSPHQPTLNTFTPHLMRWGFLFSGKPRISQVINARSETLTEKPMFRRLVNTRRCVIPANGFFEWASPLNKASANPVSSKKSKFLIKPSGVFGAKGIIFFYMAGLTNRLQISADAFVDCFVIITTRASPQMSKIHDRMPVMFDREMANNWLSDVSIKKIYDDGLMEPWKGDLTIEALT